MVEPDGLISWVSRYAMAETMTRLLEAVQAHGMAVAATIDHAAAAHAAGLALADMTLLIVGNPQRGTPLLEAHPTIGIDLPLKLLVWVDQAGATWVAYNDPGWIAARHEARHGQDDVLTEMRNALAAIVSAVTAWETGANDD